MRDCVYENCLCEISKDREVENKIVMIGRVWEVVIVCVLEISGKLIYSNYFSLVYRFRDCESERKWWGGWVRGCERLYNFLWVRDDK